MRQCMGRGRPTGRAVVVLLERTLFSFRDASIDLNSAETAAGGADELAARGVDMEANARRNSALSLSSRCSPFDSRALSAFLLAMWQIKTEGRATQLLRCEQQRRC